MTTCINLIYDGDTARSTYFNGLIDLIAERVKCVTLIDDIYPDWHQLGDSGEEVILDTCVPVTDYVDVSGYSMSELAFEAFDYKTYAEYEEGAGFSSKQRAKVVAIRAEDEELATRVLRGTGIKLVVVAPVVVEVD